MSTAFVATIQLYPKNSGGPSGALTGGEWEVLIAFPGGRSPAKLTFAGSPAPGETFVAKVYLLAHNSALTIEAGIKFIIWDNGTRGMGISEG